MTLYALTTDDQTVTTTATLPPTGARRLDTGAWVTPPADGWTADLLAACGWLPVTEVPRPADTATHTSDPAPVALIAGVPTQQWTVRPWTAEELTAREQADAERARYETHDAILDATAALMEDAHEDGQPWVKPQGAHNAYPLGRTVTHNGKTWENLTPANTHEPGVSGWREVVAEGYPAWVQPAGAHDAYILGAKVTHNGRLWECTQVAAGVNAYEPGVWGWTDIGAAP